MSDKICFFLVVVGFVVRVPIFDAFGTSFTTFDFASLLLLSMIIKEGQINYPSLFVCASAIFLLGLLSASLNWINLDSTSFYMSVLYTVRSFEYFIWVYAGLFLNKRVFTAFILCLLVSLLLSLLWGTLIDPQNYLFFKYDQDVAIGLLFVGVWLFKQNRYLFAILVGSTALLLSVRSVLLGMFLFIYGVLRSQKFNFPKKSGFFYFLIFSFSIFCISSLDLNTSVGRLSDILTINNILAIERAFFAAIESPSYYNFVYEQRSLFTESGDLSFQLRLRKWMFYIPQILTNPYLILFGLGPGLFEGAADSSYIRVIIELGLFGVVLYGLLFYLLMRHFRHCYLYLMVFLGINIFLDSLFSSFAFPLFLLLVSSGTRYDEGSVTR